MALREFTDAQGRQWTVWNVHSTLAERRKHNQGPPPGMRERRRLVEQRVRIRAEMAHDWLAFEADDGEHRRLAPSPDAPNGWHTASENQLRAWCEMAKPVPRARRRLIE